MPNLAALRRVAISATLTAMLFISSCGLLIHPERNGQINTGRLDPSIVILDAVGLLFFIVPGAIAFAVDFSTGTIYLPEGEASLETPQPRHALVAVDASETPLTRRAIEAIVEQHTQLQVDLSAPDVGVTRAPALP